MTNGFYFWKMCFRWKFFYNAHNPRKEYEKAPILGFCFNIFGKKFNYTCFLPGETLHRNKHLYPQLWNCDSHSFPYFFHIKSKIYSILHVISWIKYSSNHRILFSFTLRLTYVSIFLILNFNLTNGLSTKNMLIGPIFSFSKCYSCSLMQKTLFCLLIKIAFSYFSFLNVASKENWV